MHYELTIGASDNFIFLNLCDSLLYYIICLYLFFIVFVSIFMLLTQSHYRYYKFIMHYQQTLFLTLPFLFLESWITVPLSVTYPYYCPTTKQQIVKSGTNLGFSDLPKMQLVFKDGSTNAGNSCQVSDGAGFVLLMKRSIAVQKGLPILGVFRTFTTIGVDPAIMGVGSAAAILTDPGF